MEDIRTASLDRIKKMQIDDWLRQTDKHIREGRYIAADELLQKVFEINPENTVGHSYQDRIQFLVKQLSQRVGLEDEIYKEIKKYRDLISKRKTNQINSFLTSSQKLLDEGHLRKAIEQANKALALDPENIYTKALMQRLTEMQHKPGCTIAETERDLKFCAAIKEFWRNGKPSEDQYQIIFKMQNELNFSDGKHLEYERDIKNTLYKETLHEIWLTGGLSAFTPDVIDSLRKKFEISRIDHSVIESSLLKEFRKNRIRGTILIVDADDKSLLEISAVLRSHFFAVIAAGSLDEALACLKIATPNVIISEMNFQSGSDGFEFYEFIRTTSYTKNIPFIFMTNNIDRATLLIGKRLGVEEFILKPIDFELLVATLNGKIVLKTPQHTASKNLDNVLLRIF
ncbi:MAG: response regulator [Bacteroidota bacterium]|nr:response regulator [Bacteroidota bacterium]